MQDISNVLKKLTCHLISPVIMNNFMYIYVNIYIVHFFSNEFYRLILQTAQLTDGVVISNDNYRDLWREKLEWHDIIEHRQVHSKK